MTTRDRLVFDCNVFFQALISPKGPAGRLFSLAVMGQFELFTSSFVLGELHELTSDDRIGTKYKLSPGILDEFFARLSGCSTLVNSVPSVFEFPRDPDDARYVDLALAVQARLIVSRDKDLLSLRDRATAEGRDFASRYPLLSILTPPEALEILAEPS